MPLNESGSRKSIGENIATERRAGKPPAQAAAIAYSVAREHGYHDEYAKRRQERADHEKLKYGREY